MCEGYSMRMCRWYWGGCEGGGCEGGRPHLMLYKRSIKISCLFVIIGLSGGGGEGGGEGGRGGSEGGRVDT